MVVLRKEYVSVEEKEEKRQALRVRKYKHPTEKTQIKNKVKKKIKINKNKTAKNGTWDSLDRLRGRRHSQPSLGAV